MNRYDLMDYYGLDERDLDDGPDDNVVCIECGHEFHVASRPATRVQPAELIGPEECPECGGQWEWIGERKQRERLRASADIPICVEDFEAPPIVGDDQDVPF